MYYLLKDDIFMDAFVLLIVRDLTAIDIWFTTEDTFNKSHVAFIQQQ